MKTYNTTLKKLPKGIKFATYNPTSKDIILAEYLIAISILNGATFNQLLESANEIECKEKRYEATKCIIELVLDFINLNPQYIYLINDNHDASEFLKFLDI